MAAAEVLLNAAGLPKPNTKLFKRSTATRLATSSSQSDFSAVTDDVSRVLNTKPLNKSTAKEHAMSSSQPDPAVSTDDVSCVLLTGLQGSALEDGFALKNNDLENIVALLLWMAQDFQPNIDIDDIHYVALEVIAKHADAATTSTLGLLHTASVAKLSELINIMVLHKDGTPKDPNATFAFMKRLVNIRVEVRAASSDNATEHVELDEDEVALCYQRFGRSLLKDDLMPHQRQDKRYHLRNNFKGDTHLSKFQRSFTDNLLRKFLGDKRVAFLIWQHGLPSIANLPMGNRRRHLQSFDMLQSSLDECLQWYICLANDIVIHRSQEGFDTQLSASSLDTQERQWQQTRREALQNVRYALRLGAALAKQRDDKKRSHDEMSDSEQKILEDYEAGKIKKAKQDLTTPKMEPFRCKLQIND